MFNIQIRKIEKSSHENDGTFLQTPFWCEFKARHGWTYRRFEIEYNLPPLNAEEGCDKSKSAVVSTGSTTVCSEVAVLNRSFAKGIFSIAYIPLFPKLPYECTPEELLDKAFDDEGDASALAGQEIITPETQTIEFAHFLSELATALKPELPSNTIAIRFDPDVSFSTPEDRDLFNYGMKMVSYADRLKLRKNSVDIQPPDSTLVDLTDTEEEILDKMHSKWRYNIRLSERKGVTIHRYLGNDINLSEKIDKFYELTKITNARDGNASHAKAYYADLIKSSAEKISKGRDVPVISLYIAEHEGEEIASIMTLFSHDEAIYLYGASSNNKRNLMPNHLLQWTAIKDAKAYGSKYYDMYGMPPEGKDENHPMHGLYMFKANFGGKNIHRTGSWDIPLKAIYRPYSAAEKLRAFWHKKVIKKLKGR
ncbi:lipid II:glycine glycyltransferase FemX [Treponema bryantii]|uniref:lipid II:glycine glycyltransferase FemX n=1 Tax=Treponema bryantii TaxID=163 RepID=UPI0003B725A9|nr:peptidoglycan bridge formation glycyltransferase FemA/FemB family protein [Treponema bryantii]